MKLNSKTIEDAKTSPGKADIIFFDDDLVGFGYRLREGKGTFVAQYRHAGRTRRLTIGDARKLSPDEARKAAKKILARVELGHDPQAERADKRVQQAHTFSAMARQHLDARESALRPSSYRVKRLYLLGGDYFRPLHSVPAADITRADVASRLNSIIKSHGSVTAARARAHLSALFVWAMKEGLVPANPVIMTNAPADSTPRERVLDDAELASVWLAADPATDFGKIVRLLILSACRRMEIGRMRWSELSLEKRTLTLPPERTKNKRTHLVPLVDAAFEILRTKPRMLVGRDHVFGIRGNGFCDWAREKTALDEKIGSQMPHFTLHDLRRTAATGMADLGVQPHIIEEILGHSRSGHKSGVAGTYNRAAYEADKRIALEKWAAKVAEIVGRPRLRNTA
jgi:integrase